MVLVPPRILDRGASKPLVGCSLAPLEGYGAMRVKPRQGPSREGVIFTWSEGQKLFPIGDSDTPREFSHAMDSILAGTGQESLDLAWQPFLVTMSKALCHGGFGPAKEGL